MRPVCVPCQRFFKCKKNNFTFTEGMPVDELARPGNDDCAMWQPYKVWTSDRYECEGCGAVILTGFSQQPLAEHYQPDFADKVKRYGADQFQVNDC